MQYQNGEEYLDVPKYQTISGQSCIVGSLGKNDFRLRIQNTTVDECREYSQILEREVLFCIQRKIFLPVADMRIT